jgi:hypothetical protein
MVLNINISNDELLDEVKKILRETVKSISREEVAEVVRKTYEDKIKSSFSGSSLTLDQIIKAEIQAQAQKIVKDSFGGYNITDQIKKIAQEEVHKIVVESLSKIGIKG